LVEQLGRRDCPTPVDESTAVEVPVDLGPGRDPDAAEDVIVAELSGPQRRHPCLVDPEQAQSRSRAAGSAPGLPLSTSRRQTGSPEWDLAAVKLVDDEGAGGGRRS
jgi:hypothetical protein